jgi:hypothetical protein
LRPRAKGRTTATEPRLRPQQARIIAAAERAHDEAKRALADRRRERDEIRSRYKDLIPLGELLEVGGIRIKRILKTSGQHFRLKAFLGRHKLTKAMAPFVSDPTEYEDWQVQEKAESPA